MGSGSSVQCSICTSSSYGRCDHCQRRFCSSHFRSHRCTGISGSGSTTVQCKPECSSCSNDAVGTCNGCGKKICSSCFSSYHRTQCGRSYYR